MPVPDAPTRRGAGGADRPTPPQEVAHPVLYLNAAGTNSIDQAAHRFLATADVPLPSEDDSLPPGHLCALGRWAEVPPTASLHLRLLAAVAQDKWADALALLKSAGLLGASPDTLETELATAAAEWGGGDVAKPVVGLPALLTAAAVQDEVAMREGTGCTAPAPCLNLQRFLAASTPAALAGGASPHPSLTAAFRCLPPSVAIASRVKTRLHIARIWMQQHALLVQESGTGDTPPAATPRIVPSAAFVCEAGVKELWRADASAPQEGWKGAVPASVAAHGALACATALLRVFCMVGNVTGATDAQQLVECLGRAAAPTEDETPSVMRSSVEAAVLHSDSLMAMLQGSAELAATAAAEAETRVIGVATQHTDSAEPAGSDVWGGGHVGPGTGPAVVLRSSAACAALAADVLSGQLWKGLAAGNALLASNAPAHIGSNRAIVGNMGTMYDLSSTASDASLARDILLRVAAKYRLQHVVEGGWIKP